MLYKACRRLATLSFGILRPDLTTTTEECQGLQIVKYIGYDSPAIAERFMTYPNALFGTGEVLIIQNIVGVKLFNFIFLIVLFYFKFNIALYEKLFSKHYVEVAGNLLTPDSFL